MTVELTHEQQRLIAELVATGRFSDEQEVLTQSLRLIQEQESKLAYLRAAIKEGQGSGDYEPFNVDQFLMEMHDNHTRRSAPE